MSTAPLPPRPVLGYPRIGNQRQLKRAVESYWSGKSSLEDLTETAAQLRRDTRSRLVELGLGKDDASIPESFSFLRPGPRRHRRVRCGSSLLRLAFRRFWSP